jgi:6-phosphogluconolactonase
MSSRISRSSAYLAAAFLTLIVTVLLWSGCGGSSQSNSSSPSATSNPPASGSQPGSGSSGNSGGSGSGGSGGSGGSSNSSGTGAAYLYVGVDNTSAAIRGYKVDANGATLAEVPGSPFSEQGGSTGVAVVSKNFVYGSEVNVSNNTSLITAFRADASTGSLTQVGTTTVQSSGQAAIFPEPSGHNLYEVDSTGDILTFTINSDGTLTNTGSSVHLAQGVGGLAVSPNGQLAYATISNGDFKAGTLTDGTVVLNRDASSGALTANHQVNSNQHLFDLQFDTSGRYLLAVSGSSDHISVYSVDYSTGDLTPVPGSPFASTRASTINSPDFTRTFRLDPSSKFAYVLNTNGADPKPEYVSVFSFAEATGTLAPLQAFDMTPGTNPTSLVADQSFVFVVNTDSGFNPSNIHVLKRDASTGMLSAGGSPVTVPIAINQANEMHF